MIRRPASGVCRLACVSALLLTGICGCAQPADQTWYCGRASGWDYFHVQGKRDYNYRLPAGQVEVPNPYALTMDGRRWRRVKWEKPTSPSASQPAAHAG